MESPIFNPCNNDQLFPTIHKEEERKLFIYYKAYRTNVRAKVNSLQVKSASNIRERNNELSESKKYLILMKGYLKSLNG